VHLTVAGLMRIPSSSITKADLSDAHAEVYMDIGRERDLVFAGIGVNGLDFDSASIVEPYDKAFDQK
jgi:hypothetical protein